MVATTTEGYRRGPRLASRPLSWLWQRYGIGRGWLPSWSQAGQYSHLQPIQPRRSSIKDMWFWFQPGQRTYASGILLKSMHKQSRHQRSSVLCTRNLGRRKDISTERCVVLWVYLNRYPSVVLIPHQICSSLRERSFEKTSTKDIRILVQGSWLKWGPIEPASPGMPGAPAG